MTLLPYKPWKRRLLTCFIGFHFLSAGGYLLKDTMAGKTVRTWTKGYERGLGIWQGWGMFSPNPPNGSSYLRATGVTPDGQEVPLEVLVGQPFSEGIRWTYNRSLKLERSTFNPKTNRALRQGYGLWLCERSKTEGVQLQRVEMWKERFLHLSPAERSQHMAPSPESVRIDLQVITCPGQPL